MDTTFDQPSTPSPVRRRASGSDRTSSRMLERYLNDVEETARHDEGAALRAALALPAIATALEHPQRRTSCEQFAAWCARWVDVPDGSPAQAELFAMWCDRSGCDEVAASDGIPVAALRELRLRRHARPTPLLSQPIARSVGLMEHCAEAFASAALVHAMRRWYDEHGARSPLVQLNLARLAVLR